MRAFVICDACLGPNPYTRMIKQPMARECRISGLPFTGFRWQGALKRWKETLVCSTVAREKNCCQACLNDLEYAVPFHVRDVSSPNRPVTVMSRLRSTEADQSPREALLLIMVTMFIEAVVR